MELPRGVTLELVPPPVIECKSGTDLSIAINNLQKEIDLAAAGWTPPGDYRRRRPFRRDLIAAHVHADGAGGQAGCQCSARWHGAHRLERRPGRDGNAEPGPYPIN